MSGSILSVVCQNISTDGTALVFAELEPSFQTVLMKDMETLCPKYMISRCLFGGGKVLHANRTRFGMWIA